MSDRTQGSVRTESPSGDGAAPNGTAPGTTPPVTATQSIPTTGSQRAQAPTTAETPAAVKAAGATAASAPNVVAPAGQPASNTDRKAAAKGKAKGRSGREGGRGPRRARLQLRHIDTWSALKISLVLSIALFFIWMVAVGVLYGVLNALGVFETLNDLFGQVGSVSGNEATGDVITPGVVFGGAAIIGAINIVLLTALCTVGTFIYNLCSDLVGGLEITLSERD